MAEVARGNPEASDDDTIIWDAQPRQAAFIACPADDVGFGGARGGGKSDAVIGDWISHEDQYGQHAIGMAFRRERTQLTELIERSKEVLRPLGYNWHEQDKYFKGPRGGRLRFSYLENDSDADAYQGHSYTRIYPEEMGTFPSETPINKLQATLRSGNGVPCQMKGTCNPGGPGHNWVKARYRLGEYPKGLQLFRFEFINPFTKEKIEKTRIFVPSKVTDNRFLGSDYVANLFQVGSEHLVKAWLEGDWSIVEGAYFNEFSITRHVVRPFKIPDHWTRFCSFDWGSAKPFSVGWWALAQDDCTGPDGKVIPRGAIIRYREWYGASGPDVGLKLTVEEVAHGIEQREAGDKLTYRVADPSIFSSDGGPSHAERMHLAGLRPGWNPADNKRVATIGHAGGWDQVRARLKGDGEHPMMFVFSTCTEFLRTFPALQHDPDRPEDVDTDNEDHIGDETRYACMSRPYSIKPKEPVKPKMIVVGGQSTVTMDDLWAEHEKKKRRAFGRS